MRKRKDPQVAEEEQRARARAWYHRNSEEVCRKKREAYRVKLGLPITAELHPGRKPKNP